MKDGSSSLGFVFFVFFFGEKYVVWFFPVFPLNPYWGRKHQVLSGGYKAQTYSYVSYDRKVLQQRQFSYTWENMRCWTYTQLSNSLMNIITLIMVQRIIYGKLYILKLTWFNPVHGSHRLIKETHQKQPTSMECTLQGPYHFASYRKWILNRKYKLNKLSGPEEFTDFQNLQSTAPKVKVFTKVAAIDTRYFARSKFSRSLDHKKNFSLIWQVVFKLRYLFCQER